MTLAEPASNVGDYSVSEIAAALKRTVEESFGHVRVRGEISGYRGPHSSGHAYFALKDERARLEAVIWRATFSRLRFRPEEGMEVIAIGRLTTFPGSSKYQIVIEALEPAGIGALMALLEERRRTLAAEGLFDAARKRPIPYLPRVIGVVTSPTGAVIRDILHRLADRFPTHVIVWPVRVQGETSAAEVAAAIRGFNAIAPGGSVARPDVLIIARGGGSLEDLWSFNEEIVVRAAAESAIPLISAIGHETDTTLIDFAADLRAPTPTGAAEMAVPVRAELLAAVGGLGGRLEGAAFRQIETRRRELRAAIRGLPRPDDLLAMARRGFDEVAARLPRALFANTLSHRARLDRSIALLTPAVLRRRLERAGDRLEGLAERQARALVVLAERKRARFERAADRQRPHALIERLARARARLAEMDDRLGRGIVQIAKRDRDRLDRVWRLAETLSHRAVLARGFALVTDPQGKPLRSAAAVTPGMVLGIEVQDGRIAAIVEGASEDTAAVPTKSKRQKAPKTSSTQDSLF